MADVIKLKTDDKGIYCLQKEGCGSDSGEKYLIASGAISTCGLESIVSILSPVYSYKNYVEGIQGIRDILNKISGDTEMVIQALKDIVLNERAFVEQLTEEDIQFLTGETNNK